MQDHPVLGQVALGYSPIIDRQRAVVATRLTVFPARHGALPDAAALAVALDEVWPAVPAAVPVLPPLSLNVADEALLLDLLAQAPAPGWMIEVPAFLLGDAASTAALQRLHGAGVSLTLKGRPLVPLAPVVLACFNRAIVDAGDERRSDAAGGVDLRRVATLQAGVRSGAGIDAAFAAGAAAVVGWPLDDAPPTAARGEIGGDVQAVMALLQGIDRDEPLPRLEAVLKRDPALAFRLLRFLNSPAFGLRTEVTSFGQALLLLGHTRLKRWLAVLLARSAPSPQAQPLVYAAVRRGLLMEALVRDRGDTTMAGEMFLCGLFSLLDRLLERPLPDLLQRLPVPDPVQLALLGEGGPYADYLTLVRAIEQESAFDLREGAERLLLGMAELNRALLHALRAADSLDG